jgi:hypothetical protein
MDLRGEAERKAKRELVRDAAQARVLVKVWNSRQRRGAVTLFWPPIGAAVLAGHPFLSFACPGCNTISELDLRKLAGAADRPLYSLVTALRCGRCQPNPPLVRLLELTQKSNVREQPRRRRR